MRHFQQPCLLPRLGVQQRFFLRGLQYRSCVPSYGWDLTQCKTFGFVLWVWARLSMPCRLADKHFRGHTPTLRPFVPPIAGYVTKGNALC